MAPLELLGNSDSDEDEEHLLSVLLSIEKEARAYERVAIGIDSGAAVTICPSTLAIDYPWAEMSNGSYYKTAGGGRVKDEGLKIVEVVTASGEHRLLRTRVGRVTKWLMAVGDLVDSGHVVSLGRTGGCAKHQMSGKIWDFERKKGVFEATVEIVPFACAQLLPKAS